MTGLLPPNPAEFRSVSEWARQYYEFLTATAQAVTVNDPEPVLLAHVTDGERLSAAVEGIMLFNPTLNAPVISIDGEYVPLATEASAMNFLRLAELEIERRFGDVVSIYDTAESVLKFGRNDDVDTGAQETVWQGTTNEEVYLGINTNTIDEIVSTDAADTQDVEIQGHTSSGGVLTRVNQTVTLNGTTPVTLTTPLNRVERVLIADGEVAAQGDITVSDSGTGNDHVSLLGTQGDQQSYKAALSTADGEYLIITELTAGIDIGSSTSRADFFFEDRAIAATDSVFRPFAGRVFTSTGGTTTVLQSYTPYLIIPPNHDVKVACRTSANNTGVSAAFQGVYARAS